MIIWLCYRYQVPTVPLGVPSNALPDDLNGLVNSLLLGMHDCDVEDSELEEERTLIEFDFLVNGELLRSALGYHVEQKGLPTVRIVIFVISEVVKLRALTYNYLINWTGC